MDTTQTTTQTISIHALREEGDRLNMCGLIP